MFVSKFKNSTKRQSSKPHVKKKLKFVSKLGKINPNILRQATCNGKLMFVNKFEKSIRQGSHM